MTSEAMRDGNKQYFENLLFSKRAPPAKGQVSGHPGHPLDPPLFNPLHCKILGTPMLPPPLWPPFGFHGKIENRD